MLFGLQTVFELLLVIAVFWGIFNEDKLISFEKRLIAFIRRRKIKIVKQEAYTYRTSR